MTMILNITGQMLKLLGRVLQDSRAALRRITRLIRVACQVPPESRLFDATLRFSHAAWALHHPRVCKLPAASDSEIMLFRQVRRTSSDSPISSRIYSGLRALVVRLDVT
jgi:hypothetical protein